MVVNIINIMSSSKISIEFWMRNAILALDDLFYHRPFYCLPFNTNLFVSLAPYCFQLMVDISFLDYWLLNHLSSIDHAT